MSIEKGFAFGRHTERSDGTMGYGDAEKPSEKYPAITEKGERMAREKAREVYGSLIEDSEPGTVVFIGGASEEARVKQTAEVTGDELSKLYGENPDVEILTAEQLEELRDEVREKGGKVLDSIAGYVGETEDKKLVITYPLFLKEFSLRPHHRDKETGEHTPYMKEMVNRFGSDERVMILKWFKGEGRLEKEGQTLEVPSPQETAETHIQGINRLREFARKVVGDRPLVVGVVGHGWQLDALAVYLANNGKVTAEAYQRLLEAEEMEQSEGARVEIKGGKTTFLYRGNSYEVPEDIT
jgi:hypothetical protein